MSRWYVLLVLATMPGCFYMSHTEGYRITYGEAKWARGSAVQILSALPSSDRKTLEGKGIYAFRIPLYLPMPTNGKEILASDMMGSRKRVLVICIQIGDSGFQKLKEWRDSNRSWHLRLSTGNGDLRFAFFETSDLLHGDDIPYSDNDIRAALDGTLERDVPQHIAAVCTRAEGTLTLYRAPEFNPLSVGPVVYPYVDILQPYPEIPTGYSPGFFDQLPVDLKATGSFKMRKGEKEERLVSLRYDTWDWRLHFGIPSE